MSKRPEGRITAAEYFSTIQYSKKACFGKIPEADFSLIPPPMLETVIFRHLCEAHTAGFYDSCVARFLTLVRALETAGMLMMIIVRIASVKI